MAWEVEEEEEEEEEEENEEVEHCGPEQPRIQTEVLGHSLVRSLVRSLLRSWDSKWLDGYLFCVFSLFSTIVQGPTNVD